HADPETASVASEEEERVDRQREPRREGEVGYAAGALAHCPEIDRVGRGRRHKRGWRPSAARAGDRIPRDHEDAGPAGQFRDDMVLTAPVPPGHRVVGERPDEQWDRPG